MVTTARNPPCGPLGEGCRPPSATISPDTAASLTSEGLPEQTANGSPQLIQSNIGDQGLPNSSNGADQFSTQQPAVTNIAASSPGPAIATASILPASASSSKGGSNLSGGAVAGVAIAA
jgi:hypothetical protein